MQWMAKAPLAVAALPSLSQLTPLAFNIKMPVGLL